MLQLPIEEYFRYHPPETEERKARHSVVNEGSLQYCQVLLTWPRGEDLESTRKAMENIAILVCKDMTCFKWAMDAIARAYHSSCQKDATGVLMNVQQARMFLNQGITIDELVAKQNG